jgi:nicotinate-nucleotide pyrophosphorylase (carboxylating)
MHQLDDTLRNDLRRQVENALKEDVGDGDLTARLLPESLSALAEIFTREPCILCGTPWADEVFRQLDPAIAVDWQFRDGDAVGDNRLLCRIRGNARSILTAERTALNFLQLLSATATLTRRYVDAVADTQTIILDTRKTIPGLRLAQKYAVRCGGGENHRSGLFDAILIKENHIASAGGIVQILSRVPGDSPAAMVEIEVESLRDLRAALAAGARRVLLDNFGLRDTSEAVRINRNEFNRCAKLEASGGKSLDDLRETAATGVDYISVGALTKHVRAIDLSMRVELV